MTFQIILFMDHARRLVLRRMEPWSRWLAALVPYTTKGPGGLSLLGYGGYTSLADYDIPPERALEILQAILDNEAA